MQPLKLVGVTDGAEYFTMNATWDGKSEVEITITNGKFSQSGELSKPTKYEVTKAVLLFFAGRT